MSTIRLAYRHIIDASSTGTFAQQVFQKSYAEFRIQQQSFAKGLPLSSWSDIKAAFPKAHPALPFKVSFALAGVFQQLDGIIPGLTDTMGEEVVPYGRFLFDLLASDARDRQAHKVSLTFISRDLTLYQTISDYLVLGDADKTFLLKLRENLSIVSFVPETNVPGTNVSGTNVSEANTRRIENGHYFRQNTL